MKSTTIHTNMVVSWFKFTRFTGPCPFSFFHLWTYFCPGKIHMARDKGSGTLFGESKFHRGVLSALACFSYRSRASKQACFISKENSWIPLETSWKSPRVCYKNWLTWDPEKMILYNTVFSHRSSSQEKISSVLMTDSRLTSKNRAFLWNNGEGLRASNSS